MSAPAVFDPSRSIREGCFGLTGVRLQVRPDAELGDLLNDAYCLLINGIAAVDSIVEVGEAERSDLLFAGLYLLRQAQTVLNAVQLNPEQAAAAKAAGWRAGQ